MTARVPTTRTTPDRQRIKSGMGVSSSTWLQSAQLVNYLLGRGAVLVPACTPNYTISAGSSKDFRFRTKPQKQTVALGWLLTLRSSDSTHSSRVAVTTPTGGSAVNYVVGPTRETVQPFLHIQQLSSQSSTEQEISVRIAPTGYGCIVEGIACYALPRSALVLDGTDQGIDEASVLQGQPIYIAGSNTGKSLAELGTRSSQAITIARRIGHLCMTQPDTTGDSSQTTTLSPSWAELTTTNVRPSILARKLYTTSTTGTISWSALIKTDVNGTTASLRTSMVSGATSTLSVATGSHTAFAWLTSTTFAADCEDLADGAGFRSSRWDELTLEAQITSGSGTLYVASVCYWEA